MRRTSIIAATVLLILVGGGLAAYLRFRPSPVAEQQGDPALMLAFGVGALERSADPSVRLGPEQVKRMLPYLRVLRDTDPSDVAGSRALVDQVWNILTPEQVQQIRTMRDQARTQRRELGPPPGVERFPGVFRQGGAAPDRPTLRRQILSRLIERLQTGMTQPPS